MGPFSVPTMQLGISDGIWSLGARQGRPSRPAFSGFDVPATGQDGRPFHRYVPIFRPFRGILPATRALFGALPAAKYRSPFRGGLGPSMECRMAARRSDGANQERPSISGLADFLTPQALMRPRPGLTQSFKRQPFQALSLRSVLAGRTPPHIGGGVRPARTERKLRA